MTGFQTGVPAETGFGWSGAGTRWRWHASESVGDAFGGVHEQFVLTVSAELRFGKIAWWHGCGRKF